MKNVYSERFLNLAMEKVLGLYSSRVIMWGLDYPYLKNVRTVFIQTEKDDNILLDYYSKFINKKMTIMEKAKALAVAVNSRIKYMSDIQTYKKLEKWVTPIEVHNKKIDDCDGYAVLICYLLRLFGAAPWEVFVRAGDAIHPDGRVEGHANVLVFDIHNMTFYYLEGSFYPEENLKFFGRLPASNNHRYKDTYFVTNDLVSYSTTPWIKLIR